MLPLNLNISVMLFWSLLFALTGFSQTKSYSVTYKYETPMPVGSQTSLLTADLHVVAKDGSTVVSYGDFKSNASNATISMNAPDSCLYLKSKWFRFTNGQRIEIPFDEVTITETKECKNIHGYKAQKLLIKYSDKVVECWICKSLPAFITPLPGLKLLPGAVLEFRIPAEKISVVMASSIVITGSSKKKMGLR